MNEKLKRFTSLNFKIPIKQEVQKRQYLKIEAGWSPQRRRCIMRTRWAANSPTSLVICMICSSWADSSCICCTGSSCSTWCTSPSLCLFARCSLLCCSAAVSKASFRDGPFGVVAFDERLTTALLSGTDCLRGSAASPDGLIVRCFVDQADIFDWGILLCSIAFCAFRCRDFA